MRDLFCLNRLTPLLALKIGPGTIFAFTQKFFIRFQNCIFGVTLYLLQKSRSIFVTVHVMPSIHKPFIEPWDHRLWWTGLVKNLQSINQSSQVFFLSYKHNWPTKSWKRRTRRRTDLYTCTRPAACPRCQRYTSRSSTCWFCWCEASSYETKSPWHSPAQAQDPPAQEKPTRTQLPFRAHHKSARRETRQYRYGNRERKKKTWSEDIRTLLPEENAIFSILESIKKNGFQLKTGGLPSLKVVRGLASKYRQQTKILSFSGVKDLSHSYSPHQACFFFYLHFQFLLVLRKEVCKFWDCLVKFLFLVKFLHIACLNFCTLLG